MPAAEEARRALEEYQAKVERELSSGRSPRAGMEEGLPAGDPVYGLLLVLESPETPAALDALHRSLEYVGHPHARVVPTDERLLEEILSGGPSAIAAVGPRAAQALDGLEYPLAHASFTDSREGEWFGWSKGAHGLMTPSLAPALEDEEAKRSFWRAFLALRALSS